jgi:hypothetical protein
MEIEFSQKKEKHTGDMNLGEESTRLFKIDLEMKSHF